MSKSIRKTPKLKSFGNRSSNAKDKAWDNRKYRRMVNVLVAAGSENIPSFRAVSNVWDWNSDGLATYHVGLSAKLLRK